MDACDPSTVAPGVYEAPDGSRRRVTWVGMVHDPRSDSAVKYLPVPNTKGVTAKRVLTKTFLKWAVHKNDDGDFVMMVPDYA